jgi:hypothetical protein
MTFMEEETYPIECVRNVAKHHRSADVTAVENALAANTVVLIMGVVAGTLAPVVLARP